MKYAIDRIENNIAILENIETKEIIEVELSILPENIKESNVLLFENNEYKLDIEGEAIRRQNILNRFNRLKKK